MAFFAPTIAMKRSIRAGEGAATGLADDFVHGGPALFDLTFPRRGGARKPVVDGFAQPLMRHRHDGDAAGGRVERAQMREQVGGGLDQVAARSTG